MFGDSVEKKVELGFDSKFRARLELCFFFCPIQAFFNVERSLDGAKTKLNFNLVPKLELNSTFFCSYKTFLGVKRSSKGAQGVKLKPKKNLRCLVLFSP
jgi:hypothetical protein